MRTSALLRFAAAMASVAALASACSSDCNATCTGGVTFDVSPVVGAMARGTNETLHLCFDSQCHDITVSRSNVGGTVFVPFDGVASAGDHTLTVTGAGSFKGQFRGAVPSYQGSAGSGSCKVSCGLATVRIGADGSLQPATPVPAATTTVPGATSTTKASG